jgi:hypothetical protein
VRAGDRGGWSGNGRVDVIFVLISDEIDRAPVARRFATIDKWKIVAIWFRIRLRGGDEERNGNGRAECREEEEEAEVK